MQPINYNIDVAQPVQSAIQGFRGGLAIADALEQRKLMQQQLEQQKMMSEDFARLSAMPNPTGRDYSAMMLKYPSLAENTKKAWDLLNADQQQSQLQLGTQVHSALLQGRPDVATTLLQGQAEAYKNSGDAKNFQMAETLKKLVEIDPARASTISGLYLSSILGGEKYADTFGKLSNENREQALHPSKLFKSEAEAQKFLYDVGNRPQELANKNVRDTLENRNIESQINERAAKLGIEKEKLGIDFRKELQNLDPSNNLDSDARKLMSSAVMDSVAAKQTATQMDTLAKEFEQSGGYGGWGASWGEFLKRASGKEDAISELKQQYVRLRSSEASKMLPPGSASDKDIALVLSGFPNENANPSLMASFLRGMSKLNNFDAANKTAQAEWINNVGHLGKTKRDIEISGIKVPAGSFFHDFASQYIQNLADKRSAEPKLGNVGQRSYMKYGG